VEAVLLCDVLPDGTVVAQVLVEPIYDTNNGQRIATRTVDPVTGAAYTVQGELQECPAPETCSCQTVILCDVTTVTTPGEPPQRLAAGDFPDAAATTAAWTRTGGAGWVGQDGSDGAPGFVDFSGADTPPGSIEQTVTVTPGVSYAFSAHFGTWNGGGSHQQSGRIEIFDGAGTLLFTQDVAPTIGASGIIWPADGIVGPVNVVATDDTMRVLITDTSVNPGQTDLIVDNVSLLGPGVPGETTATATPFLRTICRTCSGTATVTDTTLDGTTTYAVQGTVGTCPVTEESACASPTTPVTSVGLCLADGTPIAVTAVRDCDGVIQSEGWLNLTTGAWTSGAVPVGTVACGDSRSIQVSGTFCDVDADGEVVGLVLVEYTYDDTGAISDVRLVDAVTGGTYTPTGSVTVCPADVQQPEQDAVILCHTAPDGTATSFLRDFRRDENGAIVAHSDYTLDGAPYVPPAGTIGVCTPPPCDQCQTLQLCDVLSESTGPEGVITPAQGQGAGTASSGVTWSVTGDGNTGPMELEANVASGDGTGYWYGIQIYPRNSAGPQTWSFGQPSTVRFSVAQVGAGSVTFSTDVIPLHLPDGYSYDAATRTLSSTSDDCPSLLTPAVATSATFLTAAPVSSLVITTPQAVPTCGTVGSTRVGGFVLNPAAVPFLRTLCRNCATGETTATDTTLDGTTAYQVLGTVGACETPQGADCEVVQLCDVQHAVPAVLPSFGTPDEQWQTLPNGVRWMKRGQDTASTGGWYTAAANAPERFDFDRPASIRYSVRFSGPTAAPLRIPAGWYLDSIVTVQHAWDPVTRTISPTASATQAGESTFRIDALTAQTMTAPVLAAAQPSGQTSQYGQITVTADVATPFLRTLCRDAGGVTTTDTTLDGVTLYEVQGVAGTCPEPPSASSTCQDCETLLLCDAGAGAPATITGVASSGTLPNGIAWTAKNAGPTSTAGSPMPAKLSNSDGAWWGLHSFPNTADAPTRWDLSRPSTVEFSVYLHSSATNAPGNRAQLPAGLEVVSLPDGYTYDATTGVLSVPAVTSTDPCSYVTDPQTENLPRFRTAGDVSSITAAPGLGSRAAVCGTFFTYLIGAITVVPGGQFLRRICRDCTGQVTSVTDTELNGTTPYTPLGAVGQCTQEPPCDQAVMGECVYSVPDTPVGFDLTSATFPDCWLGTANGPSYLYGDRVTSWEGTYQSSTGTVSGVGFLSRDLGGDINFSAFTPAIPADPAESPADYVGTATVNGVTVTLRALAGNGLSLSSNTTKLFLDNGDRIRVEFSKPVRLTVTTSAFADPPTPHNERLCGVVAETVPWHAVKLADCEGRITVVDADTRAALPANAVLQCDDDCCQPVQVCVSATETETLEFISNEDQVDNDTHDSVWTWTNQGDANGPSATATWYQMYRARYGFNPGAWSVTDSAPTRKAGWISPHPNGATANQGNPGEGPTLSGTTANPMRWWARAGFSLPAAADPDSIRVQITVLNADQIASRFRLNTGAWTALPANATYNGVPYTFGPGVVPGAQPGTNTLYFEVLETVEDNAGNGAGVMAHFIVTYDVPGIGQRSWTRMVCCDGSVYYIDEFGERQEELPPSALVIPCGGSAQPLVLCDDAGPFIRHLSYVGEQIVTKDTDLNGSTYAPTGPVRSCGA
jgi:hypothetical protein